MYKVKKHWIVASAAALTVFGGQMVEADALDTPADVSETVLVDTIADTEEVSAIDRPVETSQDETVTAGTSFFTARSVNREDYNTAKSASQGNYNVYNKVVFLDAGHGGSDPGAVYGNTTEESLNLTMQDLVKTRLEAEGYEVITARDANYSVDLLDRSRMANNSRADIFVSIHFNASTNSSAHGIETYYYQYYEDYPARLNPTYHNHFERLNHSAVLASAIQAAVVADSGGRNNGVRRNTFSVLRETTAPAVLLELGYMSNASELSMIKNPAYQRRLADGIVAGINKYYQYYGVSADRPANVPSTPSSKPADTVASSLPNIPASGTYTFTASSAVRATPSLSSPALAYYQAGQTVNYDKVIQADNHNWLTYISYGGNRRYVSIGEISVPKPSTPTVAKPQTEPARPAQPASTALATLPNAGTYTFTELTHSTLEPKQDAFRISYFRAGETLKYDQLIKADNQYWLSYVAWTGRRRYVAIGEVGKQAETPTNPAPTQPAQPVKPVEVTKPAEPSQPSPTKPTESVSKPQTDSTGLASLPKSGTYTFTELTHSTLEPKQDAFRISYFRAGETLKYDQLIKSDNQYWLSYVAWTGRRRYVAIGEVGKQTETTTNSTPSQPTQPAKPAEVTKPVETLKPSPTKPAEPVTKPQTEDSTSTAGVASLPTSGTYTFTELAHSTLEPKQDSFRISYFRAGETLKYDQLIKSDNQYWLSYVAWTGRRRYVAIGEVGKSTDTTIQPTVSTPSKPSNQATPTPSVTVSASLAKSGTYTFVTTGIVRAQAHLDSPSLAYYQAGQRVNYDQVIQLGNQTWLSYISYGGNRRYVAIPNA